MEKEKEKEEAFDLKIPPGTPEDIIALAIEKFNLKLIKFFKIAELRSGN